MTDLPEGTGPAAALPAEPVPAPPPDDHLQDDVKRLGEELVACRQAENRRLHEEAAKLDEEIAGAKAQIAAYRSVVGEAEYRRIVGDGGAK